MSYLVHALLLSVFAASASAADLTVRVIDAQSAKPIAAATASAEGRSCTTGADGRCVLALEAKPSVVAIRADGYSDRSLDVDLSDGAAREVEAALVAGFAEQVEVQAEGIGAAAAPAQIPVKPVEVMSVAGGGENVFRVLHTLPGVASPDEFSSRLSVRGGGPDENLTVMDGVEIHNPYRLFGLVSAFNPETIDEFDLSAGAFDVRHGDRLSSLLVVHARPGTQEHAITGSAALSVTDANVVVEGKTPLGSGSWLLAGRRTYYDLVAERFTDQELPSFADLQNKTVWNFAGGRRLAFFGLRSRESADATFDVPEEGAEGAFASRTRNDLLAATFESPLGTRGLSRTVVSAYENTEEVDFGGDFRNKGRRSNSPGIGAFAISRVEVTWQGRVRDHALRQEVSFNATPRHVLDAGFEVHLLETRVRFTIPADRNTQEANTSSLAGGAGLPDDLDSARTDTRLGGWLKERFQVSPALAVEAGLRLDRSTVNDRLSWSPRASASLAFDASTRLRAALGIYTQSPGYEKLVQSDYFMDLTSTGPLPLQNERSQHALLGLERSLAPGRIARVEGYYKKFDRMVVGRLETPGETAARIAEYDFPPELAASVPTYPWITTEPVNGAAGHAYGFDLYIAQRAASARTRLTGWASYTYGIARREAYGRTFPFDYDRRHAVSIVASLRLGPKLELSTTARASSGFPRSPVVGLRVAEAPDLLDVDRDGRDDELVPQRDAEGLLVYTTSLGGVDNLNTARLPAYFRVDARLTYMPRGPGGRVKLYADVINVLGRDNAGFLEPNLEHDPASDRPRLVENRSGSIPFLPSVGIHVDLTKGGRRADIVASRPTVVLPAGGWAVSLRPGSLGPGVEATRSITSRVNVRAGVGIPTSLTVEETATGTDYDVEAALGSVMAAVDWHPFGGRFHLSAGGLRTRHGFAIRARDAATYELGGVSYTRAEAGTLDGEATVRQWAPYFGVGWGNAVGKGKRYRMVFDLGLAPQGRPSVRLKADGTAAATAAFRESLARETADVSERLRSWSVYPVFTLSVSRRF
jgi:hypothetical protein